MNQLTMTSPSSHLATAKLRSIKHNFAEFSNLCSIIQTKCVQIDSCSILQNQARCSKFKR